MKKADKRVLIVLLAVVVIAAAVLIALNVSPASYTLTADVGEATPESLWRDAEAVVLAEPTGRVTRFRSGSVRFRLVEVQLTGAVRGSLTAEQTVQILQTEGLEADVSLKKGQRYLLFLDAYVPGTAEGMENAAGAYTVKGAFKGVYPMDADGNLTAVRTSYETQEQTAEREAAMRELLDSMSKG